VGPLWRGSNANSLFKAISRLGHSIEIIDEFYYISLNPNTFFEKVVFKLIRPIQINAFNKKILNQTYLFKPQVVFIYKGAFIQLSTMEKLRALGVIICNFYPDVSIYTHGKYLPKTVPLYDIIFTTKSFSITIFKELTKKNNVHFIPHGFDPDIHRKQKIIGSENSIFQCEVSFVGTWSPKKEKYLVALVTQIPNLDIKIWGAQWESAKSLHLKRFIQYRTVNGDLYSIVINSSLINLGILSEIVVGATSGDLITSRTFHIPGSGGFLLHERNEESLQYFQEDIEAAYFANEDELIQKVKYYLGNIFLLNQIKEAGYLRAQRDYSIDKRANEIIKIIENEL
jgi:spore maturation protein CgeB